MAAFSRNGLGTGMTHWLTPLLCGLMLAAALETTCAAPPIPTDSPLGFFTNAAARLLSTEMKMDLDRIQIYPTNQYTPAVHRLLQVAANIYDATTGDYFPTVFRPLFSSDSSGSIFITGFTNVPSITDASDWQLSLPLNSAELAALPGPFSNLATNVYGVPWIIGAKKGFPNFNEFVQENIVGVTRRLQVTRDTNYEIQNFPKVRLTGTNQMYLFSINSSVGLDFWNSYNSNFTDNVSVVYRGVTWMTITNDEPGFNNHPGITQPMALPFTGTNVFSVWPGTMPWSFNLPNPNSFITPLYYLDYPIMVNSVYRTGDAGLTPGTLPPGFNGPCLIPTNNSGFTGMTILFETNTPGFPLPHFDLLTTNRLQVFILDFTNDSYHVIDYVHLEQNTSRDLNAEIFTDDTGGIWNTNTDVTTGIPIGVRNQIMISKGLADVPIEDGLWQSDPSVIGYVYATALQQASFKAFFQPYGTVAFVYDSYGQAIASNYLSSVVAPYAPVRFAVGYTVLQANDPLVHYLASDLKPSPLVLSALAPNMPATCNNYVTNIAPLTALNLGSLNANYQPWGGSPAWQSVLASDPNAFNLAERDPLVSSSDAWNFPAGQTLGAGWLGQIHRGTPWQTIYLKSRDILNHPGGLNTWMGWTADYDPVDAAAMSPTQDWHLASLLASMFNTNDFHTLFSVNNPDPNAWRALLNGRTAVTNLSPGSLELWTITSNSPQASVIANAIEAARAARPGSFFRDAGDILAVPELSVSSPFFNSAPSNGISDGAYELIPEQLLPLIRTDSIGSVLFANGQRIFQFTGYDGHDYLMQSSADLVNWFNLLTNSPVGGVQNLTNPPSSSPGTQFYRSVLLN
jgi:hypothetical protein